MICQVCDVNNSEDSKFCVECGVGLNNGKEPKRVVSAEEMKKLLWSIDWEKIRSGSEKKRLIGQIQAMMKIWQNDPNYIPIIMAPRRNDGGLNNEGNDPPQPSHTVEERLTKNYYDATRDNKPCGVCGDMRCSIKHVPPIQQQYQEAFENIQRIRRIRADGKPPKSKITRRDVYKGIERRKPPKIKDIKDDEIKPHDIPKWLRRKIPKKTKENPYIGRS